MPDRLIELLIKFISQNGGVLSENKRQKYCDFNQMMKLKR